MLTVFEFLAENTVLLLFLLLGVGMAFGHIAVKKISLGAAAVLFSAIALGAVAYSYGVEMTISKELGTLGLALFAFAIGISSGPNFFSSLKTAGGPILALIGIFILASGVAVGLGKLLGMNAAQIAGTFAGALTNTPALEAAGSASGDLADATVGYSIAYLFGVIGMIIMATLALNYGKNDTDVPAPIVSKTIRVEREDHPRIGDIFQRYDERLAFPRLRRGESGPITRPNMSDVLDQGDLVTIVGALASVESVIHDLGHPSSHPLQSDRSYLDYRRITLSDASKAGKTIAELNMGDRFGATVSRVRRGDVDMVGYPDLVLQLGDRLRVVAPISQIKEVNKYLGDSTRGLTSLSPVALGLGMALGILLGMVPILNPMGGHFTIGSAAGTLIVGLLFGRVGRIGPIVTAIPYTTCQVLSEFGLLVFLAQAGMNAGGSITKAFTGGDWWKMLILGAAITLTVGVGLFVTMRWGFKMGGTKLAGLLGGAQTQPAVLAYANSRTSVDARVALGYAMVYPVAMVGKILCAKIIGMF